VTATAARRLGGVTAIAAVAAAVLVVVLVAGGPDRSGARPPARAVVASACSPVTYAGDGRPSALIVLSTVLQGGFADHGIQAAQAVKLVLAGHGWRAGVHTVGVQVCDEVPYGSEESDPGTCARIARALAPNRAVLGVIGPWSSSCAPMLSILNRSPGPVAMISASATYVGLTRAGPGVPAGDPARYRPSGRRNFARVVPADDVQAAAGVLYARRLGTHRLFVLDDGTVYGRGLAADARAATQRAGIALAGATGWRASAPGYQALAERVRSAHADAVYLAGLATSHGARLIVDLRRALGAQLPIVAPDGFAAPGYLIERAGSAAEGVVFTIATLPSDKLAATGRRFATDFERRFGAAPCCYAVQTAQAAEILLDAIAASDGSRTAVTGNVLRTHVTGGQLGNFRFDAAGDTTGNTIGVYRITGGRGRFQTAVVPPATLLGRR
jgi:branched-chain amino acid transport system substrate-binding protein